LGAITGSTNTRPPVQRTPPTGQNHGKARGRGHRTGEFLSPEFKRLVELVKAAEAGAGPWGAAALLRELTAARRGDK